MTNTKITETRSKIIKKLKENDVMPFIIDEVEESLYYLNQYKLLNIYKNINGFIENILYIHKNYCESLMR